MDAPVVDRLEHVTLDKRSVAAHQKDPVRRGVEEEVPLDDEARNQLRPEIGDRVPARTLEVAVPDSNVRAAIQCASEVHRLLDMHGMGLTGRATFTGVEGDVRGVDDFATNDAGR